MMKRVRNILLFTVPQIFSCTAFAQKQKYDVIAYSLPKGWQQQQNEGGIQLSVADQKNGAYAMVVIVRSTASAASAAENFNDNWQKLVKGTVQVNDAPAVQQPVKENGWDIISGNANYTDGGNKGMATLLSATGGGQTVSIVMMTNTSQYQNELLSFINSLELTKAAQKDNTGISSDNNAGNSSVAGLWVHYTVESGGYSNGYSMVTAGYSRREYLFKTDGTYIYRVKNWSVYQKDILFIYETGTWKTNGHQLTLTPKTGRGDWWGKAADGSTKGWGSRKKAADYKLEATTYNFSMHYYSGMNETDLVLESSRPTQRDGILSNAGETKWEYSPRKADQSLIDNPPGFKTGAK